jgi:transcriptional regulator with XRE-family HTH domain
MTLNPLKKQFIELYEKSGWTQAEVARQLELTRGGVNGIITGPTIPSLATVKLFQLILGSRLGDGKELPAAAPDEKWAEPLLEELRSVEESRRAKLVAALCEVVRTAQKAGQGRKQHKGRAS